MPGAILDMGGREGGMFTLKMPYGSGLYGVLDDLAINAVLVDRQCQVERFPSMSGTQDRGASSPSPACQAGMRA